MTLDEELRLTLRARADGVLPLPDPFAGVERRARGLRRRRTAAAVAGSALAVLAVVGAGTLLTPDRTAGPSDVAGPSPSASVDPTAPVALDLDHPWPYRGQLPTTEATSAAAAWRDAHPGTTTVVPLFGQAYEPSGRSEVVVASRAASGEVWGVLTSSEAGWTVAYEHRLDGGPLVAPLDGDEADRLLVVAAPGSTGLTYRRDAGKTTPTDLALLADGVGTAPLPVPLPDDDVLGYSGDVGFEVPVPDRAPSDPSVSEAPANVLEWPTRGTPGPATVLDARRTYADSRHAPVERVHEKVLVAGSSGDDAYLLGQFWLEGDARADTWGVVVHGGDDVEVQTRPRATAETAALALHLSPASGSGGGTLVVVPRPGTGQVLYSPDRAAAFSPVGSEDPALDGVVVFGRPDAAERAGTDRVRLLDGHGDTIRTLDVLDLLCGETSCG